MSLIYPTYLADAGSVMDADKVSEALGKVADEVDGNLGEQNWDQDGFTSRADDLETDAVLRIDHYAQAVNWTTLNAVSEPTAGPANSIRVPMNVYWSSLIRREYTTCRGGMYRIVASFQVDAGASTAVATYWDELAGIAFAFRVNGTLVSESNTGGDERSNDPTGEALDMDAFAVTMTISVYLSPGANVVELVGRPANPSSDVAGFSSTSYYEVFNHEMYVVETRA